MALLFDYPRSMAPPPEAAVALRRPASPPVGLAHPQTLPAPPAVPRAAVVDIREFNTHCATCAMRELCLTAGLPPDALGALDAIVTRQARVKKGASVYLAGARFSALYALRSGSCKTILHAEDGREQITGFPMLGDLIGLDGIGTDVHTCDTIALENSEVCSLPFERLEALARTFPSVQRNLHRFLSHDIGRDQRMMLMLGCLRAEERLAVFLLNLSERYARRGYSSKEFVLRMTREDIGSYLGLQIETVSRLFSRLQREGLIAVQGRSIRLFDLKTLKDLAGHPS